MKFRDFFIGALLLSSRLIPSTQARQNGADENDYLIQRLQEHLNAPLHRVVIDENGRPAFIPYEQHQETASTEGYETELTQLAHRIVANVNRHGLKQLSIPQLLKGKIGQGDAYFYLAAYIADEATDGFPLKETLVKLFDDYHARYGSPEIGDIHDGDALFKIKASIKFLHHQVFQLNPAGSAQLESLEQRKNFLVMQTQIMEWHQLIKHYAGQHEMVMSSHLLSPLMPQAKKLEMAATKQKYDALLKEAEGLVLWAKQQLAHPALLDYTAAIQESFSNYVSQANPTTPQNLDAVINLGFIGATEEASTSTFLTIANLQNVAITMVAGAAGKLGIKWFADYVRKERLREKVAHARATAQTREDEKALRQQMRDARLAKRHEKQAAAAASNPSSASDGVPAESLGEKRNRVFNKAFHAIIQTLKQDNNVNNLYASKAKKTKEDRNKIQVDAKERIDDYFANNGDVINEGALRAFIIERLNQLLPDGKRINVAPVATTAVLRHTQRGPETEDVAGLDVERQPAAGNSSSSVAPRA